MQQGRGTKINENISGNLIAPLIYQLLLARGTIQEIIDFRMMFEEAYTSMAMDRATSEDISRIAFTVEDLEIAIAEKRQTVMEDLAFHKEILHSTHNPLVIRVGETIMELFKLSIAYSVKHHPEISLSNHKKIFEAFCQKNKPKLRKVIQESFEIHLRNRKDDDTVEIRVPERLYRWSNWEILSASHAFEQLNAFTIEFRVDVPPGEERIITYTVQYSWPE